MDINTRLQINSPVVTTVMKDRDPGKNYYFASQRKRTGSDPEDDEGSKDPGPDEPEPLIDIMV